MTIKKVITGKSPVKVWTDEIDDNAIEQMMDVIMAYRLYNVKIVDDNTSENDDELC